MAKKGPWSAEAAQGPFRIYGGCQNNVPIVGRCFVATTYAAILFSEQ
jgi:hypothetical protein